MGKKHTDYIEIHNKKVYHEYFVEETLECGIQLKGNEVKSLRAGNASIKESYVQYMDGRLVLLNCHIHKWATANDFDIAEKRPRTLLTHKIETLKLAEKVKEKGYTLMPLKLYFNERHKCKVLIGLCKGKHIYDKREAEKQKQIERDIRRYV